MATIRPFKAIRPQTEYASRVAALPYDVMSSDEAREMVKGNEFSFLHVDKAEIDLDADIDIYDRLVYEKARDNLYGMLENGVTFQDEKPMMYIYRQVMEGRIQAGLVVCASIDEYISGAIKKHELTRADKEKDRINHVTYCNANTGPIFLTYRVQDEIDKIIQEWMMNNRPVYDFSSEDGIIHTVWVIDEDSVIEELTAGFAQVPALYIADGHHRNASAVKVGLNMRGDGEYDRNAEFNYYLAVIFPDKDLRILDYNRVVKDLNGLSDSEFMDRVAEKFTVEPMSGDKSYKPDEKHTFGMYLNKKWYKLTLRSDAVSKEVLKDAVLSLDVSLLQNELLSPVLNITDPRVDKRIDFIGGIRGLAELTRVVDSGKMKVAFAMFPTSMDDLMNVADSGQIMPPKSTWFEPKLRSGLFVHSLS